MLMEEICIRWVSVLQYTAATLCCLPAMIYRWLTALISYKNNDVIYRFLHDEAEKHLILHYKRMHCSFTIMISSSVNNICTLLCLGRIHIFFPFHHGDCFSVFAWLLCNITPVWGLYAIYVTFSLVTITKQKASKTNHAAHAKFPNYNLPVCRIRFLPTYYIFPFSGDVSGVRQVQLAQCSTLCYGLSFQAGRQCWCYRLAAISSSPATLKKRPRAWNFWCRGWRGHQGFTTHKCSFTGFYLKNRTYTLYIQLFVIHTLDDSHKVIRYTMLAYQKSLI